MGFLLYLRSECWRTFRQKQMYIFSGACALVILGLMAMLWAIYQNSTSDVTEWALYLDVLLDMLAAFLPSAGMFAVMITMDAAFSGEHKYQTMKNSISFGTSRLTIYLGKLLTAFLASLFVLAVVIASFLGFGYIFLGVGDGFCFQQSMRMLGWVLLGALPLWIAALSLMNLLLFAVRSETGAAFAYLGLMTMVGMGLSFLEVIGYPVFGEIERWLISSQLGSLYGSLGEWAVIWKAWGSGAACAIGFSLFGYWLFRKMEVR